MNEPSANQPLVSIIVPALNRERFIERCVRSILNQTYRHLECIVMDGGSKDGSVAILQRLASEDSRLKFVSEPDGGEVYANNNGIDRAEGDITGIQASDDYYVPDAVENAVQFLQANPDFIGVGGDGMYVDGNGNQLNRGVITYRGEMCRDTIRRILMLRYKSCLVCHGSFFGWRKRLLKHGKFDPEFMMTCDWEYYLRLLNAGERIGSLRRVQFNFTIHPEMGAVKYAKIAETQRALLHKKYGMKWYHELVRSTVGRAMSYLSNPYRSPLVAGAWREFKAAIGR